MRRWLVVPTMIVACGHPPPPQLVDADLVDADLVVPSPIPVVPTALQRSYTPNDGLVTGLGAYGWPLRDEEPNMDPVIVEARRFYDTVKAPNAEDVLVDYPDPFTGAPPAPKKTAPL